MQSNANAPPQALSPADDIRPATRRFRIRGALVAAGCWGALLSPLVLPALPACSFKMHTGYPCPSCGMTTSMTAMVHGQVAKAWRAQPFGLVLFAGMAAIGLAGAVELVTGRDALRRLRPGLWWVWAGLAGMFAGWAYVLAVGLASGRLPLR